MMREKPRMMQEKPILFLPEMMRAILWDRKTQTRRIIKGAENAVACNGHCPKPGYPEYERDWLFRNDDGEEYFVEAPYSAGDLLGARDNSTPDLTSIILKVKDVRVERLQDISEEDAIAEGCPGIEFIDRNGEPKCFDVSPEEQFVALWDSIYAKRPGCSWDDNPFVFVIEFRRVP